MLYIICLLFSLNTFAMEGHHLLSDYPDTEFSKIVSFNFIREDISPAKFSSLKKDIEQRQAVLGYTLIHKYRKDRFYGLTFSYSSVKENDLKNNASSTTSYQSKGFTEPSFTFHQRFSQEPSSYKDFRIIITPSLFEKRSGSAQANRAIGGHVLKSRFSVGELYDEWEGRLYLNYDYFCDSKTVNKKTDVTTTTEPYYQAQFGIEFQHSFTDQIFVNIGSGFQLTQDMHINNSDIYTGTRAQLGTGSITYIGADFKSSNDIFRVRLFRSKNDFFMEAPEANFKGDYTVNSLDIDYITNF